MRITRMMVVCAAVLVLSACGTPAPTPLPLAHSIKGYELYSWRDGLGWHFTLITGTNRVKTYDEIVYSDGVEGDHGWVKITVAGEHNILRVLARLPKGEDVFWGTALAAGFAMPPADVIGRIEAECRRLGVNLVVA